MRYAKNIIFYSLPEDPDIFLELVNLMSNEKGNKLRDMLVNANIKTKEEWNNLTEATVSYCLGIYTIYDYQKLERIVGTQNIQTLITQPEDTHTYY